MLSAEQLRFAQKYPFSSAAKKIVKENSFSLDSIPENAMRQSALMIYLAYKGKPLEQKSALFDEDAFLAEIQAFPLAKILLSLMKRPELFARFASMIGKKTFLTLEQEQKKRTVLLALAEDLEIKYALSESQKNLIEISMLDFLKADFSEQFMKLCNQKLERGKVFLNENDFARFLAAFAQKKIADSLPVATADMPKQLKQFAADLSTKLVAHQFKEFDFSASKSVAPAAFPECISLLYSDLLSGKNLPHLARFDLAVFLAAAGMPKEQIIDAFRKAPNFSEKITRYQIEKILQKKYKPVSCAKLREHGLQCANCNYKHPLQYYRAQLKQFSAKPSQEQAENQKSTVPQAAKAGKQGASP